MVSNLLLVLCGERETQPVITMGDAIHISVLRIAGTACSMRCRESQSSWRLRKQRRDRLRLHQLARLVEVVVDDRLRVDADGVVDRRQEFDRMDRVFERRARRSRRSCRGRSRA